jgi:hypothetical protein
MAVEHLRPQHQRVGQTSEMGGETQAVLAQSEMAHPDTEAV